MKKLLLPAALILSAISAFPVQARAQGYTYGPEQAPYAQPYPAPYAQPYPVPNEPGPALADMPRLADRLLEETAQIRNQLQQSVPPGAPPPPALPALIQLQAQVQHFESSVDNLGPTSEPARAEFARLLQTYGTLANMAQTLPPDSYAQFAHIQRQVDRMAQIYGGLGTFGYQYVNPGQSYQIQGPGLQFGVDGLQIQVR